MTKTVTDQADGLRRLLSQAVTRVVAVAGMRRGEGATTAAMSLAAALTLQGRDVLLVDEHGLAPESVSTKWGLVATASLSDVATGRMSARDASAQAACGARVLPAQPAEKAAIRAKDLQRGGFVLIDVAFDDEGRLSALAQQADEVLLVLQPNAPSITAAYAGIKRLHYAHGLRQLRFLLTGASSADEARKVAANLASTGSRYLAVSLQPSGWVRTDPHLADASRLGQSVVEAFPTSPAAVDFRSIASEMGRWPVRGAPAPATPVQDSPAAAQFRAAMVATA